MAWRIFFRPGRAKREIASLREQVASLQTENDGVLEELRLKRDYIARLEAENREMSERIKENGRSIEEQRKTIDSLTIELNRLQRIDKSAERLREENKVLNERITAMRAENRMLTKRGEQLTELLHGRMGGLAAQVRTIRLTDEEESDLIDDTEEWTPTTPQR